MSHRAGLPAQRIHRGAHQTATVAHPTATNCHLYPTAATTTFRRDELSLPTGPRDRTHLAPDRSTTTRSSPPPPTWLATTRRSPSPLRHFTGNHRRVHWPYSFDPSPAAHRRLVAMDTQSVALAHPPRVPEHLTATTSDFIVTNAKLSATTGRADPSRTDVESEPTPSSLLAPNRVSPPAACRLFHSTR